MKNPAISQCASNPPLLVICETGHNSGCVISGVDLDGLRCANRCSWTLRCVISFALLEFFNSKCVECQTHLSVFSGRTPETNEWNQTLAPNQYPILCRYSLQLSVRKTMKSVQAFSSSPFWPVFCFLFLCSCVSFALSVVLHSNKAGRLREIAWLCGRIRVHCTSSDGAFTATCSCINFRYIDQIDHLIASIWIFFEFW